MAHPINRNSISLHLEVQFLVKFYWSPCNGTNFNRFCYLKSRFVWTEKIRTKNNPELEEKLTKIFKKSGHFYTCSADGESMNIKKFFKKQNIYLSIKPTGRKANLVSYFLSRAFKPLQSLLQVCETLLSLIHKLQTSNLTSSICQALDKKFFFCLQVEGTIS